MTRVDENILRNQIAGLLIHHLADTGPTPGPEELPEKYSSLIEDLLELGLAGGQADESPRCSYCGLAWDVPTHSDHTQFYFHNYERPA